MNLQHLFKVKPSFFLFEHIKDMKVLGWQCKYCLVLSAVSSRRRVENQLAF